MLRQRRELHDGGHERRGAALGNEEQVPRDLDHADVPRGVLRMQAERRIGRTRSVPGAGVHVEMRRAEEPAPVVTLGERRNVTRRAAGDVTRRIVCGERDAVGGVLGNESKWKGSGGEGDEEKYGTRQADTS